MADWAKTKKKDIKWVHREAEDILKRSRNLWESETTTPEGKARLKAKLGITE